jgi:pimeloyl-ACP methyl ester carboxylesterase
MNPDPGRFVEVNGVSLYVEEHGDGVPVLLMHGFPTPRGSGATRFRSWWATVSG